MHNTHAEIRSARHPRVRLCHRAALYAVACGLVLAAAGCASTSSGPDTTMRDLEAVPLPELDGSEQERRNLRQIPRMIVQRMDVPLNEPLDGAWATIDQNVFPSITQGAWRDNGLRIGVLYEDQVTAFAEQMPQVLNFFEQQVLTRSHPIEIMQAAPLRADTRFSVDLTLPPSPATEWVINGRKGGQLQLLAQMEEDDGRWYLTLIPHLYRPQVNGFDQRTLMERDLDGRVFYELAVRVELKPDRLVAVGLYWPWPDEQKGEGGDDLLPGDSEGSPVPGENDGEDDARELAEVVIDSSQADELSDLGSVLSANDTSLVNDPAAPPQGVRVVPQRPAGPLPETAGGQSDAERAMPPLRMHFGRVLLTGVRARRPVQTMLLISMPPVEPTEDQQPAARAEGSDGGDAEVDSEELLPQPQVTPDVEK